MPDLFSKVKLGTLDVANRVVRSATHARMADSQGKMTGQEIALYKDLSAGGVGLIITGHAYVRHDGLCSENMLGIDSDDKIPGLAAAARAVHESGAARIVAQINFGGGQVAGSLKRSGLLVPSPRDDVPDARVLTEKEMEDLILAYIQSARRAREAGLDGVQLHCAHGYFLNQLVSPHTNKRTDQYGGSLRSRFRFLKEVITGIRESVGTEFPILMKIAGQDDLEGGLKNEESVQMAKEAETLGLNAVEISGGMPESMNVKKKISSQDQEGVFSMEASAFKKILSIPVISVHGYRSLEMMQKTLDEGKADMISISRPLVREPDLAHSFQAGLSRRSSCISCNLCLTNRKEPLRCFSAEKS